MKVLKKGTGQKGRSVRTSCTGEGNGDGGCTAVLLVEEADVFQTGRHSYDGSSDYFVTFKCPECGTLTDLDDSPFHASELPTQKTWAARNRKREPAD